MKKVVHETRRPSLVLAAVLTVFVVAAAPETRAFPIASSFFTTADFSTSGELIINATLVDDQSNPSREAEENGGIGPIGLDERLQFGIVGRPESGEVVASVSGRAGLALHAQTFAHGFMIGGPENSDLANVAGFGHSQARVGVENRFIALPRAGSSADEAVMRFAVATRGGMFARTEQGYPGTAEAISHVQVGVGLTVPGCPGCLARYRFEDVVRSALGEGGSSGLGIDDEDVIEGVIPLGVPITVNAGLFVQSTFRGNAPQASSQLPAGSVSGETGASFLGTLLFGVTSPDPVDFVWASDLFFDRQPSVTSPVSVPAPSTFVLLAAALVPLMIALGRRPRP